ncbi:choice-of-anchor Q domain-containing protein [Tenacibaculum piscium]|uniref:choice-of-anchor Q domain-containing protein n=2 Tax=Tenacibaculum piscium TaxID=1458515 RepID=UPI001F204D73|nr:choice-of-anchor Q domain-containing protein [Tenacibaculum piscium]
MKKNILLLLLLISSVTFAQIPINSLQAMYQFTEGGLTDAANGNNFLQTGTALTKINDRFNTVNNAISLNGDYLTANKFSFGSQIALSFWVKTSTNDSNSRIIFEQKDNIGFNVYLKDGKIGVSGRNQYYDLGTPFINWDFDELFSKPISDNNWHHIVVNIKYVKASDNKKFDFHIDVFTDTVKETVVVGRNHYRMYGSGGVNANTPFKVANNKNNNLSTTNKYLDDLDDLFFYDKILTQTEVTQLAQLGGYGFCFSPDITNLSITNITEDSADVTWTDAGTYDIAYGLKNEPFANYTIINDVTTGSYNILNLSSSSFYNVYYRTKCTSVYAPSSNWSLEKEFRTDGRYYVKADATGANDGSSWINAYTDLQDALLKVKDADEVWVAKGTYIPDASDKLINFEISKKNVTIYGGFKGTESLLSERNLVGVNTTNETILSGDLMANDDANITFGNTTRSDNSLNVVKINGYDAVIDGFTISGGNSSGNSTGTGISLPAGGYTKGLILKNSIIKNNVAGYGAGLFYEAYRTGDKLIIDRCIFENNLAKGGAALSYSKRGRYAYSAIISNSLFKGNISKNIGTGNNGSAGSAGMFRGVAFSYGNNTTSIKLINNTYVNNSDLGTSSGLNNFNRATIGVTKEESAGSPISVEMSNCIFWGNTTIGGITSKSVSGLNYTMNTVNVFNSIDSDGFSVIATANKTNVSNANPLFTSATDFTLQAGSPAKDTGDNAKIPAGTTTDLVGNQRIHNTTVDMGAYEFGSVPPLPQTNWIGATDTSWNTASNWSNGVPTNTLNAFVFNGATNYPVISNSANAKDITIENSASLTISPSANLTAENIITNDNLTIESDVNSYGSLKVINTVTGKATYKSYVSDKWNLVGSPVVGQDVASFVTNSSLVSGTVNPNHKGLGIYENGNTAPWTYYKNTLSWGSFDTAKAYSIKKTTAGTVDFRGTITTDNVQYTATGNANNTFEMISNPYTAYLNANSGANSILSENSSNLKSTNAALYFWNDTTKNYDVVNNTSSPSRLKPGQGFFVQMATTNGVVNFTPAMLLHQQSSSSRQAVQTSVALTISDEKSKGNTSKTTQIKYLSNTNDGLDVGYDAGYFDGGQSKVGVYTKLADGTYNDTDFMLQCVNKEKISGTIIPVGIKTSEAREVVFSAKAMNLPENLNVYLEDKETNKVTELSNGGEYKATVFGGSGRFYVHTKTSSNLNPDTIVLKSKLSVYKANNSLVISGLEEKSTVILYNMIGKQVFREEIKSTTKIVSLPSLASGIYIVKVQSGATQISKKISIQ